jgi:hypothetical protein
MIPRPFPTPHRNVRAVNRLTKQVLGANLTLATLATGAVLLAMVSGCTRPTTSVAGVVTLDGKPAEKAIVQFSPERRDARTAVALTNAEGRYEVAISPVPFRVAIVAQKVVGQKKDDANPSGPLVDVYEDVLPSRYSDPSRSNLRAEPVESRRTVVDFQLSSGAMK